MNENEIRNYAYMLAREGKFSMERIVPAYCKKKDFSDCFSEDEIKNLEKDSSINHDLCNIKNLRMKIVIVSDYPENTFLEDLQAVLDCNKRKDPSMRTNPDYVYKRCLEIKKQYYESEIRKIAAGAESKKAKFIMEIANIKTELPDF